MRCCKGDPDVDHWSTYVGQGAVRFYLPLNVQLPNDFFAQAVIVTKGLEQRERVKAKLEKALANEFPSVIGRVYPLELGPPVGWPLQYRVSGPQADRGARHRLQGRRHPGCRSRCLRTSTTTGWSRRARSASASTRTRRACWA